jgi:hypothetical protein
VAEMVGSLSCNWASKDDEERNKAVKKIRAFTVFSMVLDLMNKNGYANISIF